MKSQRREGSDRRATVPTDSISDIAFLLIIFFILTTSIRRLTGFTSEIPSAQRAEQTQATEKMPAIKLNQGALTFNDEAVSIDQLRARLAAQHLAEKPESQRIVVLEASGAVPYETYFQTLSAISANGGIVGLISEEKGGGK
jgi:biopolymer transport protein ExbD